MKKVLIIGFGISGQSVSRFFLKRGYVVTALDAKGDALRAAQVPNLEILSDQTLFRSLKEFESVVVSPGIAPSHPIYVQALKEGIEIVGEIELALRYLDQRLMGITGTNGKTTVTLLIAHVLNQSGILAKALGNIGTPLIDYVDAHSSKEVLIVELSSYQLETLRKKAFDIGLILNITPDHLDRYSSMEEYALAKCRLKECIKEGGLFYVHEKIKKAYGYLLENSSYRTFGQEKTAYFWTDRGAIYREGAIETILPLRYREYGAHESENCIAAWAVCKEFGVTPEQFLSALETFKKPAHRIEFVKEIEGISFYDDSKGTNIDASIQAVLSMKGHTILIAGGVDKGASYIPWRKAFKDRVKQVFAIGQAAPNIYRELNGFVKVRIISTLSEAVHEAFMAAERGDNVLLSPGCSSFDMFRDYAHRGEEFQHHINDLEERRKKA